MSAKPSDKSLQSAMGASANQVVNAIRKLVDAAAALTPGVKECELARESTQVRRASPPLCNLTTVCAAPLRSAPPARLYN